MTRPIACVTGASSGLGRDIALALASWGWDVAIGARRAGALEETAELIRKAGGRAVVAKLDLRDPESIDGFVARAFDELGPVSALINNAGVSNIGALDIQDVDEIAEAVETNLVAPMLVSRATVRHWGESVPPNATIVFISSMSAVEPTPHMLGYCASKAGLEQFAKGLRLELRPRGIRVISMRLGSIETPFRSNLPQERLGPMLEAWKRAGIPLVHRVRMNPATVAETIVSALAAPLGAYLDEFQLNPQ